MVHEPAILPSLRSPHEWRRREIGFDAGCKSRSFFILSVGRRHREIQLGMRIAKTIRNFACRCSHLVNYRTAGFTKLMKAASLCCSKVSSWFLFVLLFGFSSFYIRRTLNILKLHAKLKSGFSFSYVTGFGSDRHWSWQWQNIRAKKKVWLYT